VNITNSSPGSHSPKILVLILAIQREPWLTIENTGQSPTWKNNPPAGVRIIRYVGRETLNHRERFINLQWRISRIWQFSPFIRGKKYPLFSINNYVSKFRDCSIQFQEKSNTLVVDIPDLYPLIGGKTLAAFRYAYENLEFDYIYRTNVSSYLDLEKLLNYISNKPRNDFYAGHLGFSNNTEFASGSGYFLSKDLVKRCLKHASEWDHDLVDDVSLGNLLTQKLGLKIVNINRLDITLAYQGTQPFAKNHFHFRCKSDSIEETVKIMNLLHSQLKDD